MLKQGMILCDRYEILSVVGAGGMSIVYKARDHRLNRNVAIKVLKPEFCNDKNFVTKFKTEAQASAGLTHPNIVNVYDVYDDEGVYFIVLELVEGITLKEYIQQNGRLGMEQALDFSVQIASGLEAAHENHIIHRDIKPQNIIVAKNGNLKVTDFGIAKAASSNTLTSGAVGSVHYISPEQARGGYSDERSDIYSLGITMYEMVTGRVPFEGDNNVSVALMHIQNEMIPPRQYYPDIYSSFEKVIQKATQKKPERRYLTASALIADLKRVQNNPNIDIVVAPTAVTNSPTKELTEADVRAIRDGSAYKDPAAGYDMPNYGQGYNSAGYGSAGYVNPYANGQMNTFNNPPVQNEMGEIKQTGMAQGISVMPVTNQKINELLNEDPWEDELEEEFEPAPVRKGSIKKVADDEDDAYDDVNDGGIDPGLRKAVAIAGIVTAVIIAIVIMIVVGKVTGFFKFGKGKSTDETTDSEAVNELAMIDVIGYSEDAAIKMLKNMGFSEDKIKIVHEENDKVQEGYVFEQNFEKGDMVDVNDEIELKVSAGAEAVEIPDVSNYSDQQACTILQEAGFHPVHGYSFSDEVEKDYCIKTEPEAHEMAPKGSDVKVIISNGSEVKKVNTPNLNGLTEAQAINSLTAAKLEIGTVTHEHSDTVPKDQVMSQNPAAGTEVTEGTTVDIVISDGPEEKEIFYTASISGFVRCIDASYEGWPVTVQISFNGEVIKEDNWTIQPGQDYTISATKSGLKEQSGTVKVDILFEGENCSSSFAPSTSISYAEESQ